MTYASIIPGGAKRILLTGAAGFIGSHVCDALLERGDHVLALDNFDEAYDPRLKLQNLAGASQSARFRLVHGDVRDGRLLEELFDRNDFDVVVHLAARAGVRPSIIRPALYDAVNVAGTTMILQQASRKGISHVVLASSSSVYGATSVPPFSESDPAAHPSSPYAATKRANELSAYAFHHLHGMSISCLRFFTVFGPRQRPEMAIHKFTRMIDQGEQVPIYGDGTSTRDYTFVDDIVGGVLAAIDRPHGYRIYNLGTTATTQLLDLVRKIGTRLGREPDIIHLPVQGGDVPTTHADIALAQQELGYRPTTTLDEGLTVFVDWYCSERVGRTLPAELVPVPRRIGPNGLDESLSIEAVADVVLGEKAS